MQSNAFSIGEETMTEMTQETTITDGTTLTLPALSDELTATINLAKADQHITQTMHQPLAWGYPDPLNHFGTLGFSLQPLNQHTARVLLVIDHPPVLQELAVYAWCYANLGLTLLIDENTIVRPFNPNDFIESPTAPSATPVNSMEVA